MEKKLYDLTNPQKSIWLTEQFYKNTNLNNICGTAIIDEIIDFDILKKAINLLIEKNDSFRLKFIKNNQDLKQYVEPYTKLHLEIIELESTNQLSELEKSIVNTKFDLEKEFLFNCKIFKFPNNHGGFIVNVHHLIADSWTLGLLTKIIINNYCNLSKNIPQTEDSEYSYLTYIENEKKYLSSNKYIKDQNYWNSIFETNPNPISLPGSIKERSTDISCIATRKNFHLNKSLVDKINTFCSEQKVSPFNFFMSILAIYIYRITNTNDFVIGTPILNRSNFYDKNVTGMFVNTCPLRMQIENNINFTQFISQVASRSMELLRHQKYPYQSILEDIRKKDSKIPNLYNIMLSYQVTHTIDKSEIPYSTRWIFNNNTNDDLDIQLYDVNNTGELDISYDYNIKKYKDEDIENLHNRLIFLIKQILINKDISIDSLEIVTPEEKNKLLVEFNNTFKNYSSNQTIIDLFEEQANKTPDNIALIFENQKLTYKELNEKANSLAYYLRNNQKINKNDFVGIMVSRSMEMIISILATLKAGGAYIPIDPNYPKDRIHYMLKNSNAKILLTQKKLENNIDFNNKLLIDLDSNIYNFNKLNLEKITEPEDLAYIIFTSGSTGTPKGVMVKHKSLSNLTNYCNNYIDYLKNPTYQSVVSITTVSFDIFVFETLISLQKGLKLIIANEKEQTDPSSLNTLIKNHNIKIMQTTPSRMQLFVNHIKDIPEIKNLKYIILAGEQLPPSLVNTLHNLSNIVIYNGYGPSETTVFSTLTKIDNNVVTIGKPLDNTQIYILDKNLKPVPIGVTGELYISGDGVSKGYLNNAELTNKSFIKNPFISNSIMYKSGDIGMYTEEGKILCLGRSDNQVKIRGLRIELGEIEDKINELHFINSCVVVKKANAESHEFLCAYYTANSNIESSEIRKYIGKFLPAYMIPQYFVQLKDFPYTPNGKIDKKELPEPQILSLKKEIVSPKDELDSKLIKILKKLLNIDIISMEDSFFELGGDSLHAINLSLQIQDNFNVQIFSKDILENPIIQDLSTLIRNNNNNLKESKILKVPQSESYKISSAQKRIFFASKVAGNSSTLYNVPGGIIIDGDIDSQKLEKCLNILINRHESLRTFFILDDENVVQKIEELIYFKLEVESNHNFENLENIFKEFIKPFDLSKAPMFRAKLIKFTNGKCAILTDMHHIISDGASLSILIRELFKLYNDENLTDLKITYKDFAEFENKQFNKEFYKEAQKYWLQQFEDEIPILNLPTTYSRPTIQSFKGKKIYSQINLETKEKIDKLARKLDVTPYIVLLSTYYILLSKYSSQKDIIIGTPIVGRDILETQDVIGMFVNTLALRNKIDPTLSFKDFIVSIKNNILNAYKYQIYPFDELVNKLNIKRDTSRNPLFDTMFIYQNNRYDSIYFNGSKAEYFIPDAEISKFDLSLEALPSNDEIKLSFEYSTKLFSEKFIKDFSNHYLNILNDILDDSDRKIEDICILSQKERNKILYEFNNTKIDYKEFKTISKLFEEQAEKTPDNIAIVFENEKITFKELNEKSNSLAHFLRHKGISKNSLVGIMVNRCIEVVIAMLATIKAGGAYIPIDPTYPKDRINYMLNSSNAEILLTKKHLKNHVDFNNKVEIDLNNSDIYKYPTENLNTINTPDDLIYCIFTSGSTGLPKGVMITHKVISNFTNYCNNYIDYLKNPVYDTIVSITTISFDLFVYEALISLQNGLKLVISNENEQTTPQLLNDLMEKNKATIIQSTPSIMQIFLNNIDTMPALKKLKYVILAGEQLPLNLVQTLHKLNIIVYNGYGPSETHYCTLTKMNDDIVTIGKPICNSQMYILDQKFNPVPVGVTGDIYISGDCVGKGYLNNKELTNKSFIKNPFLPDTMMYKSGDLGKYLEDGNIICLGRSDHQIKIRGLRIELEEIESLILKYPNINKVTVVKQTIQNREFISAYFVANKRIVINQLRKYLAQSLPRYMIPSYYITLEDLPYTPNGKIDKKALPLPTEILNISKEEYVPPKTKLQKQLVTIFEKVLNTKPIGINDNFFELGGDSLLAMNLNVELQKISNKITYQDIFRFPTIYELEEIINSDNKNTMFTKVENLSDNILKILKKSQKNEKFKYWYPKNILLTGATGFLGIHILEELLKFKDSKIYCIVRDEPGLTATKKLHQKLNYYFGNKYDNLIDNRIFAITGNISKPGFGLDQDNLLNLANSIDVIINSAANVAHYGNYNDFYNANVVSVKYIIDFCKSFKKKFYHISTIGVAGRTLNSSYLKNNKKSKVIFDESSLYIGQEPENVYTFTKFEAEIQILNAINNGLDAYILRMGNLMPRYKDGVFQENLSDNAFINRLASFIRIGILPDYMLHNQLEFTPVDYAAKSICKILTHQTNANRIFHLLNHKTISVYRCLKVLKKLNYKIEFLPEKDFIIKISEILKEEETKGLLKIIIDDFDESKHINYNTDMIIKSNFTVKYLRKTFFGWPKITNRYLIKFVNILRRIL